MSDLVANPAIQGAELLVPKAVFLRPYVWPFSIIYPIFLQIYFQQYGSIMMLKTICPAVTC